MRVSYLVLIRRTAWTCTVGLLGVSSCQDALPGLPRLGTPSQSTYVPTKALECEADSAPALVFDTILISGSGQFPVASPDDGGASVIAFRGRGSHVSIDGRLDFAVLDPTDHLLRRLSPSELDSPLDDRNPAFIALSSSEWLLLYAEVDPGGPNGSFDIGRARYRLRFSRTTDGGMTWLTPSTPVLPGVDTALASPYGKMRRLADGTVLATIYDSQDSMSNYYSWRPRLLATRDSGRTWSVEGTLPWVHSETAFLPVGGDTVIAAMRSGPNWIEGTISPDLGRNWTPPVKVTEVNQVPGDLAELPNGELLLIFGDRTAYPKGIWYKRLMRIGLEFSASGVGFAVPVGTQGIDFGYPSVVRVLPDGRVRFVYYVSGSDVPGTTQLRYAEFCPRLSPLQGGAYQPLSRKP